MTLVPSQLLLVLIGLLGMFFAYALGRMWVRLRRNRQPIAKALTWILRTAVAVFAIVYTRGFDGLAITLLALIGLALAAGIYMETRPRRVEETRLFREQ